MPRIPSRPELDLSGKWIVADLPSMMGGYLEVTPDPHVTITHKEFETFTATFQFGAQSGVIHGRVDEVWPTHAQLFFTFVGEDEGTEIFGAAPDAAYHTNEDRITGTMRYHDFDDLPFVWQRAKPAGKSLKKPTTRRKAAVN